MQNAKAELARSLVRSMFAPYQLNSLALQNRLVMAPMTRGFATDGTPNDKAAEYYAKRAAAGIALILTEGVAPNLIGSPEKVVPNMFGDAAFSKWADVVKAVHGAGGFIMPQLWHTGLRRKVAKSFDPTQLSLGPSEVYPELDPSRKNEIGRSMSGKAMTERDIEETIESYAAAAQAAHALGFDGVELHAAHGYMLDQFFWAECNRRDDRYGGSLENRLRIATEIVQRIKRRLGTSFPVGLRFSQWKLPDFYDEKMLKSPAELENFLSPFIDVGVDFFHASTRRYWEVAFEGSPLTLAGWTKKISGKTTIAVGSLGLSGPMAATAIGTGAGIDNNFLPACRMIDENECDLIAVGRAVLADPDWAEKVRTGRFSEIIPYSTASLSQLA